MTAEIPVRYFHQNKFALNITPLGTGVMLRSEPTIGDFTHHEVKLFPRHRLIMTRSPTQTKPTNKDRNYRISKTKFEHNTYTLAIILFLTCAAKTRNAH